MTDQPTPPLGGAPGELWTLGHWNCPAEVLGRTLDSAAIELVADVRKLPGSRTSPQFDADQLASWLGDHGIGYTHLPELGGRRPRQPDVPPATNAGWRNPSFRNYADYTLGVEFAAGLAHLAALAGQQRTTLLCGEPLPWRCHRLLIANILVARGWRVVHLQNNGRPLVHRLGQWGAPPELRPDGTLTYPAPAG